MNDPSNQSRAPFWERPLATLDRGEWEALCDVCGRCCTHKLEDEETGLLYPTNVTCKLLDRRNGRCLDYKHRKAIVEDCVKLDPRSLDRLDWAARTPGCRPPGARTGAPACRAPARTAPAPPISRFASGII